MTRVTNARPVLLLAWAAIAAAAAASALLLAGSGRIAAVPVALAGAALVPAGRRARRNAGPRSVFVDSVAERAVDAMLLGSVAWVALPEAPRLAGAALAALVAGYLASYLRARAVGLGFRVEESVADRSVHLGGLALGLATGYVEVALWAAAAWSIAVTARRAFDVARQGEPA